MQRPEYQRRHARKPPASPDLSLLLPNLVRESSGPPAPEQIIRALPLFYPTELHKLSEHSAGDGSDKIVDRLREDYFGVVREDYNPDEPRDDAGKWTSGGGGGGTSQLASGSSWNTSGVSQGSVAAANSLAERAYNASSPQEAARLGAQATIASLDGKTGEAASQAINAGNALDAQKIFSDGNRNYAPVVSGDMREYHDAMMEHATSQDQPRAIFTAGGAASGKSGLAGEAGNPAWNTPTGMGDNRVYVNPDDAKMGVRMGEELKGMGRTDIAATASHEMSSDMSKTLTEDAISNRMNLVIDGVGDSRGSYIDANGNRVEGKFEGKINDALANNYDVEVRYAVRPTPDALQASVERAQSSLNPADIGRVVDPQTLIDQHAIVSQVYMNDISHMSAPTVNLYATGNGQGRLIASIPSGSTQATIYDPMAYGMHLAKATPGT